MQETEFEVTTPAKIKQCKVLGPSDSKWQEAEKLSYSMEAAGAKLFQPGDLGSFGYLPGNPKWGIN